MEFDGADNGLGVGIGGRGVLREINKNDGAVKVSKVTQIGGVPRPPTTRNMPKHSLSSMCTSRPGIQYTYAWSNASITGCFSYFSLFAFVHCICYVLRRFY